MAGQAEAVYQQALSAEENKAGEESGHSFPEGALFRNGSPPSQEKEQGGKEQAVSHVGEHLEQLPVKIPQNRERLGYPEVAVAQKPHQVQDPCRRQRPGPSQTPPQPPGDPSPQQSGGQIPKVVKYPIKQEGFEKLREKPLACEISGVQGRWQVEQGCRPIEKEHVL